MDKLKLISMEIHMGNKHYFKPSENDPSMSPSASSSLYNYSKASTEGESVGPSHDLSDIRNPALAQTKNKTCANS